MVDIIESMAFKKEESMKFTTKKLTKNAKKHLKPVEKIHPKNKIIKTFSIRTKLVLSLKNSHNTFYFVHS